MKNMLRVVVLCLFGYSVNAIAVVQTITFDDAINGEQFHFFDENNDGTADVVFSTTDLSGFNTLGPGSDQLFVDEPGLEGTTSLTPDLRVDFLQGAVGSIGFGFATMSQMTGVVQVFDESHQQIGSSAFAGDFFDLSTGLPADLSTGLPADPDIGIDIGDGSFLGGEGISSFPEGEVAIPFLGIAAYATIDFNNPEGRYIIDNFTYDSAGTETIALFEGTDPDIPLLPDPFDPENPEFIFELEILEDGFGTIFPIFIDPIIAVGYSYEVVGSTVATVLIPSDLPNGDGDFKIVIAGVEYDLTAGTTFDIAAVTGIVGGVSSFDIIGIDTAESLDPADALAFNTGLTFISAGAVTVNQTPITIDTDPASVPEPGSLLLFSLGLFGLTYAKKRLV